MPKKYQREIEELLALNANKEPSSIKQLLGLINNKLSIIRNLTNYLLGSSGNKLIIVLFSIALLTVSSSMLPASLSAVLWIILIILTIKYSVFLLRKPSKYQKKWRGRFVETKQEFNLLRNIINKLGQWGKR